VAGPEPEGLLHFVVLPAFERAWVDLRLDEEALRELELVIMADPGGPIPMPRTGGLRKLRFVPAAQARGKSGAYRVGYAYYRRFGVVVLILAFGKGEKSNLSAAERKEVATLLGELEDVVARKFGGGRGGPGRGR
jgi:hypothetical protein